MATSINNKLLNGDGVSALWAQILNKNAELKSEAQADAQSKATAAQNAAITAASADATSKVNAAKTELGNHTICGKKLSTNPVLAVSDISGLEGRLGGLTGAMHFKGTTTTSITDNATTTTLQGITGTLTAGDVVLYDNKEFVWGADNKWHQFGDGDCLSSTVAASTYQAKADATSQYNTLQTAINGKAANTKATTSADGIMSKEDKAKLDGIAAQANKTTVENVLTSDSTVNALSAAQGKALKGLVDGKAATGHKHAVGDVNAMTGYAKATATNAGAIVAADTLSVAIGKLEFKADKGVSDAATAQSTANTANSKATTNAGAITQLQSDLAAVQAVTGSIETLTAAEVASLCTEAGS